ncbi:unnamed protein product, partial [Ectocarpus sp. 4 AP-2014]
VSRVEYLPAPVEKLGLVGKGNEVVHLIGQGPLEDDDKAPFQVVSGGGSDLARASCSLRHDTAYKPHEVNAVHSIPGQDVVITSSSISSTGPHVLTVWDLPTQEERSSEKQFLPEMKSREETPTQQTVILWAPAVEMVLTGSSSNGSLLGWELGPLRQSAKLWLHDAGITQIHELVGHTGGAPHLVTASLDGTIAVCGGAAKGGGRGDGVLQRLQAHEKGIASMEFCLHHSLAMSAGVFVNAVDTTPDILVWGLDRDRGLLENDVQSRLRGHEGQVVGIAFTDDDLEVITGGADGVFLVWQIPSLVVKQRFTRAKNSPLVQQSVSCFALVPRSTDRPMLLVAGMLETAGLDIFARMEERVHEELIKAEFCPYLQRLVTVSARRVTIWDAKSGEALTTLTSERLLGNDQADITAVSSDHQGHKLVVGADTGEIRACFSHSGSVIRQLDPHNGPVNWLSFASRKTDMCVFSIGGDGELHVLDAADEKGYIKSPSPSAGRRCKRLKPSLAAREDTNSRDNAVNHAEDDDEAIVNSDDHLSAGQLRSRRGASRVAKHSNFQPNGGRSSEGIGTITGGLTANPASLGIGECGAPRAAEVGACAGAETGEATRKGGRSVLLRQVGFASNDSEGPGDVRHGSVDEDKNVDAVRPDRREAKTPPQQEEKERLGTAEECSRESRMLNHNGCPEEVPVASTGAAASSMKSRLARAARTLMSSAVRDGLLEREIFAGDKANENGVRGDLTIAKPTFDMTACAADDHLSIIATAATSDGGVEATMPAESGGAPNKDQTASTRVGRASSSLHLWDAERMSLLGTFLVPCLALTRDLTNAAAAFNVHPRCAAAAQTPVDPSAADPSPTPVESLHGNNKDMGGENPTATVGNETTTATSQPPVRHTAAATDKQHAATSKTGTGLNRPALVTALMFLSPYPLLMGASTGGAVVVWRTLDCVCVQVGSLHFTPREAARSHYGRSSFSFNAQAILLPADVTSLRKKNINAAGGSGGHLREENGAKEEETLTCLARGAFTGLTGEETTLIYVGNGNGDIVVAHLSPTELAELSGAAKGPVPCQRRPNHNPYRAVRVELTPQVARFSLQAACRAQKQAAAGENGGAGVAGGVRADMPRRRQKGSSSDGVGPYNFAVPSSGFHSAWAAHSGAVTSISWIQSPPSLLSSSADGLAKIWKPDGSAMLGQLDINNRRPERAMYLAAEASRHWAFVPGSGGPADCRHEKDGLDQEKITHNTAKATTATTDSEVTKTIGNSGESTVNDTSSSTKTDSLRGGDGNVEGDLRDDVGVGGDSTGAGAGSNERRGRSGRQQQQQHDREKRDEKTQPDGGELRSPDPTRQLQDFEDALEASSSKRTLKTEHFHLGRPMSLAAMQPIRKTPLCGKRWRTKSAPWPAEDESLLERSVSEQGLPTAGSVRVGTHKGMRGYVRPTAGSAEDAALKRTKSRGATGVVLKDTMDEESGRSSLQGRPLGEWLEQPEGESVIPYTDGTGEPVNAVARGAGESPMDKTIKGLPPVAVLAGSHGGCLIASGITIAGDRGGGGFNVKAARAAARTATRRAALAEELANEGERNKRKRNKADRRARTTIGTGASRRQRQGTQNGRELHGGRSPSSWGLGQGDNRKASRRAISGSDGDGIGAAGEISPGGVPHHGGGSLAPSFGGMTQSVGSVGSVGGGCIVGTEASESTVVLPVEGAADTRKLRELNEDSVVWASTRRGSGRSSASSKNRRQRQNKEEGSGQVETIRRLVHMGLF